jgi:hypothetical protein
VDLSQRKAQFSLAYLHAVATAADLKLAQWYVDDESVDATIGRSGGAGTLQSPRLDVQLKCSAQSLLRADGVYLPLKRKNFDDLRQRTPHVPRILVVLLVPEKIEEWVTVVAEERMCLHRHAWWKNLMNEEERPDVDTPTVVLPRGQLFDAAALVAILDRVGRGERP